MLGYNPGKHLIRRNVAGEVDRSLAWGYTLPMSKIFNLKASFAATFCNHSVSGGIPVITSRAELEVDGIAFVIRTFASR